MYKDIMERLNNNELSTKEIKTLIKTYKGVSLGVKDIILIHRLEDELSNRLYRDKIYIDSFL